MTVSIQYSTSFVVLMILQAGAFICAGNFWNMKTKLAKMDAFRAFLLGVVIVLFMLFVPIVNSPLR